MSSQTVTTLADGSIVIPQGRMQDCFMKWIQDQAEAESYLHKDPKEPDVAVKEVKSIEEKLKPFQSVDVFIEPKVDNHFDRDLLPIVSFRKAQELKLEAIWDKMAESSLIREFEIWLSEIQNTSTKRSYYTSINELIKYGFIDRAWSVQQYSVLSPDLIVDRIKTYKTPWSHRTREARIACFLAFTRYLSRKTEGVVRRGVPSRDGIAKTFSTKSKKVSTPSLTRKQLHDFLRELDLMNVRDGMIARLCVHGGKRISEVLSLTVDQIDFENQQIRFAQFKSKFTDDYTIISYEFNGAKTTLESLKSYIGDRKDFVFVTAKGKPVQKTQVDRNFAIAGKRAGIHFRMSPHVLRATFVTLAKIDGFSDSEIMRATGHSSSEMVNKYDKRDLVDNATRKISLI